MKFRFLAALLLLLLGLCLPVTGTVWLCGAGERGPALGCGTADAPADCCGDFRTRPDEQSAAAETRSPCGLCFILPAMEKAPGGLGSPTATPPPKARERPVSGPPPVEGRAETPVFAPALAANPARTRSLLAVWRL